ncbi:DUF2228 domain-containing protein [Hymenobacter sp. BT664]|uniref:DUF2228 domain-containing protein n=1 Tax=Hymenobacter montanus TaxID=2771359 RepID=A0A927BF43_9BACT|nr:ADP-ribosylation family protein [Hymenobacter montanus]MBD2768887.1 DUF2228 domain-containing protein [Hymenobacter montanus]
MKKQKELLKQLYGFEFPESFFSFYEFTKKVPEATFQGTAGVMYMSLGEVFQVFSEIKNKNFNPVKISRYYSDPPEFFTILRGHTDGRHWGYYIDDFNDLKNICVVSIEYELNTVGNTIFEAFRRELELMYAHILGDTTNNPTYIEENKKDLELLDTLREILISYETAERPEKGWDYYDKYSAKREITANTRDNMGIVVPPHLYRPIKGKDHFQVWNYVPTKKDVDALYKKAIQALHEGYPGTALKAGKDLWIYHEYFDTTYKLLNSAYEALNRPQLCATLQLIKEYRDSCYKSNKI